MGLISRINKLNANDPFVRILMSAIQSDLDEQLKNAMQTGKGVLFDECSEAVLRIYEKEAGVTPQSTSLADRRSAVMAKWISDGVPSLKMIQKVADSWSLGKTRCSYTNLVISVEFADKGIPTGINDLMAAIEDVKPAHIAVNYIYRYNTWNDVNTMTWANASNVTWEEITIR